MKPLFKHQTEKIQDSRSPHLAFIFSLCWRLWVQRLDKTHRNKKRSGESWQLLLRMGWRVRAGTAERRSGESQPGRGRGWHSDTATDCFLPGHYLARMLRQGRAGILVACNLCGANIRMLVSLGIISGGNEILYKRGGVRVAQIFTIDVLQHSNNL